MLPAINVCLELDGDSSPTSTILSEKLSSLPKKIRDFSYPEIQEALLTLLENENLFQTNVQLTQGYCLGMKCHSVIIVQYGAFALKPEQMLTYCYSKHLLIFIHIKPCYD